MMQSHRQSEFSTNSISRIRPLIGGLPTLKRLRGKISPQLRELPGLADRATRLERLYGQVGYPTLAGYLTYLGSPTSM